MMTPHTSLHAARTYAAVNFNSSVPSASPHGLIMMLLDGAIEALGQAQTCLAAGKIDDKNRAASKALRIIEEGLRASLDRRNGGQLAVRLDALYEYMNRRTLTASLRNEAAGFAEVAKLLLQIRDGWSGIAGTEVAGVPTLQ